MIQQKRRKEIQLLSWIQIFERFEKGPKTASKTYTVLKLAKTRIAILHKNVTEKGLISNSVDVMQNVLHSLSIFLLTNRQKSKTPIKKPRGIHDKMLVKRHAESQTMLCKILHTTTISFKQGKNSQLQNPNNDSYSTNRDHKLTNS